MEEGIRDHKNPSSWFSAQGLFVKEMNLTSYSFFPLDEK